MSFYTDLAIDADALLAEFGAEMTLTKTSTGAYNVATGSAAVTSTNYTAVAAKFDYEAKDIDGTKIKHGDQRVYMSALQTNGQAMPEPTTDDRISVGGRSFAVVASRPISPAGTVVLHDVQVRGV